MPLSRYEKLFLTTFFGVLAWLGYDTYLFNAEKLYDKAKKALISQNFDKAQSLLEKIVKRDTDDVTSYALLAKTYIEKEKYVEAEKIARKITRIDKYYIDGYVLEAEALIANNRLYDAEKRLNTALNHTRDEYALSDIYLWFAILEVNKNKDLVKCYEYAVKSFNLNEENSRARQLRDQLAPNQESEEK